MIFFIVVDIFKLVVKVKKIFENGKRKCRNLSFEDIILKVKIVYVDEFKESNYKKILEIKRVI